MPVALFVPIFSVELSRAPLRSKFNKPLTSLQPSKECINAVAPRARAVVAAPPPGRQITRTSAEEAACKRGIRNSQAPRGGRGIRNRALLSLRRRCDFAGGSGRAPPFPWEARKGCLVRT